MIRLAAPAIGDEELAAVAAVLRSGQLVQGPAVARFEQAVAEHVGAAHAVAVSSGTAALHLALVALGVGPGDRVAVPTFSWPATANVVAVIGAEPVFVDIDPATFDMDPARLDAALAAAGRVRAVLPVHAFGRMAECARIAEIAARHGAVVVEDAACALGATLDGRAAGMWGTLGCFSFHPRKTVTTGEGGVITTDDAALARRLRALRNHGMDPDAGAPEFMLAGLNYRLTEFQGALGECQMRRLPALLARRRALAARYDAALAAADVTVPDAGPPGAHAYQSYVVLLPAPLASARGHVIAALRAAGVEATIGTHHIPLTTYYRQRLGFAPGDFPVTDDVAARALTLPLHGAMHDDDVDRVVAALIIALGAPACGTCPP